jgi:hypothetical protein
VSMSEETEVKAPARKKAKKAVKRAAAPKKADDKYAGMTVKECCANCNANACVISGQPYCAHPRKGGLHPDEMSDNAALARRKEAEAKLRNQLLAAQ